MTMQDETWIAAEAYCRTQGLELGNQVGGGSFKRVFRVLDHKTGTAMALKIVKDPTPSPRTAREIDAIRRCNHPAVGKIIEVGQIVRSGFTFDVMLEEYLAGGSLGDAIRNTSRPGRTDIVAIAGRIGGALAQLQQLKLVHRDIKPDNIMFRQPGWLEAVLVDFGLVRDLVASSLTASWAPHGPGTPYFSSPEQLNNEKTQIDWRSDQFSLGVTLYFAYFDRHPFQHEDEPVYDGRTVERVAKHEPVPQPTYERIETARLGAIGRMIKPWPVNRFRTPQELLEAWQMAKE